MTRSLKLIVAATLLASLAAGAAGGLAGESWQTPLAALHVFLFNLTAGGLAVMSRAAGDDKPGLSPPAFFALALAFCAGAFFGIVPLMIGSALALGAVAEAVRWKRFSRLPLDFFRRVPVSQKFEQAAVLCLSLGLFICAATLLNNHHLRLIELEKLDLHVFYLGFSFPISLYTFSLILARAEAGRKAPPAWAAEFIFWALNLGVIAFFFFIIFELYPLQFIAALVLLSTVAVTAWMHLSSSERGTEWTLMSSALAFLAFGSVTGMLYILELWLGGLDNSYRLLSYHSAATLFGWNLTGLILLLARGRLQLRVPATLVLGIHWALVLLLPLARTSPVIGAAALILLLGLLAAALASPRPRPTA